MRTFKYIKDPRAFEIFADETRRRIIYLLRGKEQTVSQLADSLGKTPQAVYHQINILSEAGLVEVAREERVGHLIETYFRATAEVFEFSHGESSGEQKEKEAREAMDALRTLGYDFTIQDDELPRIAKVFSHEGNLDAETEEKIAQLPDAGFLTRQTAYSILRLATMSEKDFDKMLADTKEARRLLVSGLHKKHK